MDHKGKQQLRLATPTLPPQLPHMYDISDVPPVDLTSDFDGEDDKQESATSACAKDPAASFIETCVDEELTADERIKATQTHFFVSGGIGPTATPVCAGKILPEDMEKAQAMA
ncbi:hypothetical protein B0A49_10683 [Cryomyces minteri]|uniref:Uncharacterized protein n=1 Tax=Cryomyces minteri TaxID=331657 RepID=A0A4U0WPV3_9PEZI|nr:hypothetical protein B0A49_10683 [Cryomyces minteri]